MLVGRDDVLAQAAAALTGGRSVLLCGERGSGRSAVAAELARLLNRRAYRGSGLRLVDDVPLLALSTAVREDLAAASDPPGRIAELVADGVLVVEDLQWCDAQTHDLLLALTLPSIATACRDVPSVDELIASASARGWSVIELAPLADEAAATLSPDPTIRRRAGGNPSLLRHLAMGGGAGVHRVLAEALNRLSDAERDVVGLLAVADAALPIVALPDAVASLQARGVVRSDGTRAWLRTPVLGEQLILGMSVHDLHRRVADMLSDHPRARAVHLRAAGDLAAAHDVAAAAAAAAVDPIERRDLLSLVVECGDHSPQARAELLLASARCGRWDDVARLGAELGPTEEPVLLAAQARAARARGDLRAAQALLSPERAGLETAVARVRLAAGGAPGSGGLGAGAEAEFLRAADQLVAGQRALAAMRTAQLAAAGEVDWDVECAAWGGAVLAAALEGDRAAIRQLAIAARERCATAPAPAWRIFGESLAAVVGLHADGATPERLSGLQALLDKGDSPIWVAGHIGLALADLGRGGEAAQLITSMGEPSAAVDRALQRWLAAECELTAARPRRAMRLMDDVEAPAPLRTLGELTGAWARWWVHEPVPSLPRHATEGLEAADAEREGVAARAGGAAAAAADAFAAAGVGWQMLSARAELRCRWAEGDSRLEAGDEAAAIELLRDVEGKAAQTGQLPLQAHARESLRRAGIRLRRAAATSAGSQDSGLSTREYEVMVLVRQGMTSAQVAAQLGVATSTIETQVSSAIRKLGAANRRQAALLLDTAVSP